MGKHCEKDPDSLRCKAEKYCETNPDKLRCKIKDGAEEAGAKAKEKVKEKGKEWLDKAMEKSEKLRVVNALRKMAKARKYFRANRDKLQDIDDDAALKNPAGTLKTFKEAHQHLIDVRDAALDLQKTKVRFSKAFLEKANKELADYSEELKNISGALQKGLDPLIGTGKHGKEIDAYIALKSEIQAISRTTGEVQPALNALIDPALGEDQPTNNEWLNKYIRVRNKAECALDPVQCVLDQLPDVPFVK